MQRMAKKKGQRVSTTAAPKREREGYNINSWVDRKIGRALDRLVEEHRPHAGKKGHLEVALIDYLTKMGYWPPQDDA